MAMSLAEKFTFLILIVLIAIVQILPAPGTATFRLIRTLVIFTPLIALLFYPFGVLSRTSKVLRKEIRTKVGKERWNTIHAIMKLEKRGVVAFGIFFLSFVLRTLTVAGPDQEVVLTLPRPVDIILSIVLLTSAIALILTKVAIAHHTSKFREFTGKSREEEEGSPWRQFLTKANKEW